MHYTHYSVIQLCGFYFLQILEDQLESEKGENERLKTEIDELKNRPITKQSK